MVARYWVGGTGTWDASDTTHWASASNGAGGQSAPVAADTVVFDNLSGAGTVTVVGTMTVSSIICQTHTGTLDFASSNMTTTGSVTISGGTSVHTIKWGTGPHTFNGLNASNGSPFGLTLDVGTARITLRGGTLQLGMLHAHIMRIPAIGTGSSVQLSSAGGTGAMEFNYLEMDTASGTVVFAIPSAILVHNGFHWAGRPTAPVYLRGVNALGVINTDAGKSGFIDWAHIHGVTFGSTVTLRNCYDGLGNTIFIPPPQAIAIGAL